MPGHRLASRLLPLFILSLLFGGVFADEVRAQAPEPEQAAVAQLRKATTFSSNGLHHALLLALRDLRDPTMRPFFVSLVQAEHWSIQLDAILGLAELDENGLIDPWLLGRLRNETDRIDAIRVVLQMEMVDRERVEWLLQNEDLPAVGRVILLAEQHRLGGTPDDAALQRLAGNPDPVIAGLATLILAQIDIARGAPATAGGPLATYSQTLKALPALERDAVIEELAAAARRYRLPSAIDLLAFRVTGEPDAPGPQESVVGMALALDPARGVPLWRKAIGERRPAVAGTAGEDAARADQARRVRFGLILLINATQVPAEVFDVIPGAARAADADPLLASMAAAGRAVASNTEPASAIIDLYEMGHRRSARWAMDVASRLGAQHATRVYRHVIDQIDVRESRTPERRADAIDAASQLVERDAAALAAILAAAEDDGPKQEAILLGLANSRSPAAAELAASVRRIGMGRADSLALLVVARGAAKPGSTITLTPSDLRHLGIIAGGGGGVDETLRAQAAWLYLRLSNRLESALPRIVASP